MADPASLSPAPPAPAPAPPAPAPAASAPRQTPARRRDSFAWRVFAWWSSAAAAALQIAALAIVVATGAVYESTYGPEAAAAAVYHSGWFAAQFALLAVTIAGAAAVRWPWRRHQYGFVVVHLGLLLLIVGFALAGNHRLDGQLAVLPGRTAAVLELPEDELVADDGTHRRAVRFAAVDHAGYPSAARFLLASVWPVTPPGVHRLDAPLPLIAPDTEGDLAVDLLAVADTARPELGWEASADSAAHAALRLDLQVRTPNMPAGAFQDLGTTWIALDGDRVTAIGPLTAGIATATDPQLLADFLDPTAFDLGPPPSGGQGAATAPASADPASAPRGHVLVYWQGVRHDVPVPADLPAEIDLAPDLGLRLQAYVANPRVVDGRMTQDDAASADPFIQAAVGTGPEAKRDWHDVTLAALHPLPQAGPRLPEARFIHPLLLHGDGTGARQGWLQLLAGPDGRLNLAWSTRTKGWGGSARVAPGADWQGDVVGDAHAAMELRAAVHWLPHARQAPVAVDMQPDQHDKATRWIQLRATRDGHAGAAWIARGSKAAIALDDGSTVPVGYDHATYDLRRERGFALHLDRFDAGQDPGGEHAATYRSEVTVVPIDADTRARLNAEITAEQALRDRRFAAGFPGNLVPSALAGWLRRPALPPTVDAGPATVTMNEPLERAGVAIYQASYFPETDDQGNPTGRLGSVFTVARDPGRPYKYAGSALLVGGILLLYFLRKKPARAPAPRPPGPSP